MKEAVIMTREEYKEFYDQYQELENRCYILECMLDQAQSRVNVLWDALNRPAIEESVKKADEEYYKWCDEIAKKYEKLDEEEWITSRAKFYNNGVYDFCQEKGISEEEAYAYRQYYSGSMDEYADMEFDVAKTEGWSDLPYYKHGESWILSLAMDDAWERYKENKNITGWNKGLYWHLWSIFWDMLAESDDHKEFFR